MSKFARDPYIVAGSGRRDPFGRRGRRVGALALYLDAAGVADESAAWECIDAAFRALASRELPPSKSRRPANVRANEQRRRWHRTLDALTLRYVHGLSLDKIGARLREPVCRERVRQMLAKGLRVMRYPTRFKDFQSALAQELDETTNPISVRGVQPCGHDYGDGRSCERERGHDGFHEYTLPLSQEDRPPDAGRDRPRRPEAHEAQTVAHEAPSCAGGGTTAPAGGPAPRRGGEWNFNPLPTALRPLGRR